MNLDGFRPLLAASIDVDEQLLKLAYPMIASPKIDGIRVVCHPTLGPVTRSLKPVANEYIRKRLLLTSFSGFDGEIVVGANCGPGVFERTTGAIRSHGGSPDFTYWVFDDCSSPGRYIERFEFLCAQNASNAPLIQTLEYCIVRSSEDVQAYEATCLKRGYEGIMLRHPDGKYKFGRSTLREQILLKLKRFKDAEATIIGFEALERNQNEQTKSLLGLAARSSHKAGRLADNLLGTLRVTHPNFGEFGIGSGFDVSLREEIWQNQDRYIGQVVTFKYQEVGTQDKPRFPIFLRFRPEE